MNEAVNLDDLPRWDLSDLYPGPESREIEAAIEELSARTKQFHGSHESKVAALSAAEMRNAVSDYEGIHDLMGRIGSYAGLLYTTNMGEAEIARSYQGIHETLSDIGTQLLFFTLEINRMDDAALSLKLKDPALAHYRPWFRDVRTFRDHELSDEAERLLHEKSVSGREAWVRLFDETMARLRFTVDGESLAEEECLHLLSDKDRGKRQKAAQALTEVFDENAPLFSLITNTLAKDKATEDRWRRYATPSSSRHLANQVEPEVVSALAGAVREAYPRLSHRYYALKAEWMGLGQLEFWDRNAPLPEDDDTPVPWDDAVNTVLEAYKSFSPALAEIGQQFFDKPWIDASVRPGKQGGAFSHPTVPSAHPYIMLNYMGKTRDVMTLAHELGHGVHQVLAAPQGALLADTPLTIAETASVFGEMLTFKAMLGQVDDPARRRIMLAGKVEDMLNTVVRQIAFHFFETAVHDERARGELTPDRLSEIWMQNQEESLGPSIRLTPEYRNYWCYIPHFVHTPFYVYAYAFGDCLVNSLYGAYEAAPDGFEEKYLDLLRAGGAKRHGELLAPFGLDARDPAFWAGGLKVISDLIDELEAS